jgi:TonB family protein
VSKTYGRSSSCALALLIAIPLTAGTASAEPAAEEEPPAASITPPQAIREVQPIPPEHGSEAPPASLLIELTVLPDGTVEGARVIDPFGTEWEQAALDAVSAFTFEPARRNGEPVAVTIRYRMSFGSTTAAPPAGRAPAPDPTQQQTSPASPPTNAVPPAAEQDDDLVFDAEASVQAPPREPTRRTVSGPALTQVPGTRGDAMRAIEMMPGVARTPTSDGFPILRGAAPYDSQALIDGHAVPLLYHMSSVTSTYNSKLLERIDLYPSNFSARFGRVYGGIVEAITREPKRDRLHATLELSMLDSSALVEAPVGEGTSMALAARRSNIDFFFSQIVPDDAFDVVAAPLYWDYQAVVASRLSEAHRLQLSAFGSNDRVELILSDPAASDPVIRGAIEAEVGFHQLRSELVSDLGKGVSQKLSLMLGYVMQDQSIGATMSGHFDWWQARLRSEWSIPVVPEATVIFGADVAADHLTGDHRGTRPPQLEGDPDMYQPNVTQGTVTIQRVKRTLDPAAYVEAHLRPHTKVLLVPGVRTDYFSSVSAWSLDPRFSARCELADSLALKGGVGWFTQAPLYYEDLPDIGNPNLKPAHALHTSIGAEYAPLEELDLGVDAFYKHLYDRVVGTEGGAPPFFVNDGSGRIHGLELLAKIRPTARTYGFLAYTLSRSERRDHDDAWRLFDYDQTHNLSVAAHQELGAGWRTGARFRLVSGNPMTPVVGSVYNANVGVYQPLFGAVNSERNPMFHQLDLMVEKTWRLGIVDLSAYLDLQNAYNAQNQEGFEYSYDYTRKRSYSGLPIFPNLGVRGEL